MFLRCLLDDSKKFVRGLKDVFKEVFKMFKRRNEVCKKFIDVLWEAYKKFIRGF